jgi:excinuclease ABC subunit C
MKKQELSKFNLPDAPGVYFFRDSEGAILYIGKATSLKDRVRSYFNPDLVDTRGLRLVTMVTLASSVTYQETSSVLEALLLESKLIKEHNPIYNAKEKDDKSFTCVVITKEKFPRVLTMRIRDFEKKFTKKDVAHVYGPFASLPQLREAMKIIRKMFPYRDTCEIGQGAKSDEDVRSQQAKDAKSPRLCFNAQLKLCPGVCKGQITEEDYAKNINNIKRLFDGKKTEIKKSLEKDMKEYAKRQLFEKAAVVRNTLFAIDHIKDISLIKEEKVLSFKDKSFRIEAYDAAHISGTSRVGVMVVIEGGHLEKNEYRKFKLEENVNDDYEGLRQIMLRRFSHKEWQYPDLIVIDGGQVHKQTAEKVLVSLGLLIPCVSVVKDERHKPKDILGDKVHVDYHKKDILLANGEAHRFAIGYHKTLRNKLVK